jgi:acyl-CoA synthetase (AMP-forming)/AMP-acid ligase II
MTRRAAESAGKRLIRELSQPGDSYSIKTLIERAGQTADWLTRLDGVLNGDRREWMSLKIGTETVEVVVNNALREARQLQTELRHLLGEIFRQRANIPMSDDDDDVLADL